MAILFPPRPFVLLLLAACGFQQGELSSGGPMNDGRVIDQATVDGRLIDASTVIKPYCDTGNSELVACYEFENTTQDASSHALHATMTGTSYVTGRVGKAVHITDSTAMDVAENAAMVVSRLTIEAWIRPSAIPQDGERAGLIDKGGEWSIYLYPNGDLRCTGFQFAANIQPSVWTHVACTYDGANIHIFVNGLEVASALGAPGSGGTTGLSIGADNPPGSGSPLLGDLDQLRIFNAALSAPQICADAAVSVCP